MKKNAILLLISILLISFCTGCSFLDNVFGTDDGVIYATPELFIVNGVVNVPAAGAGKIQSKLLYKAQTGATVYLLKGTSTYEEVLAYKTIHLAKVITNSLGQYTFGGLSDAGPYIVVIDIADNDIADAVVSNVTANTGAISNYIRETNKVADTVFSVSLDKLNYVHGNKMVITVKGHVKSAQTLHVEIWNENGTGSYVFATSTASVNGEVSETFNVLIPTGWPTTANGGQWKAFVTIGTNLLTSAEFGLLPGTDTAVDETAPVVTLFQIKNGDASTNNINSTLNWTIPDATHFMLSNDNNFTDLNWIPIPSSPYNWTLASGADGTRTIYAKFADDSGNYTAVQSDNIEIDTIAPTVTTFQIKNNDANTDDLSTTLNWTVTDATKVMLSNSSDFSGATWISIPNSPYNWDLSVGAAGTRTVYAKFSDDAGNETAVQSDTIDYSTGPEIVFTDGDNKMWKIKYDGSGVTQYAGVTASYLIVSNDKQRIVFKNTTSRNWDYMTGNGTGQDELTADSVEEGQLYMCADGSKTVYRTTTNQIISVVPGGASETISDGEDSFGVDITADGSGIVFSKLFGINWFFKVGSANPVALGAINDNFGYRPNLSPDGSFFVFRKGWDFIHAKTDGTDTINQITAPPQDHVNNVKYAMFSPDGTKIAFRDEGTEFVWVMNNDDTGSGKVVVSGIATAEESSYSWSEDSSKILYIGSDNKLYSVGSDGSNDTDLGVSNVTFVSASYKTVNFDAIPN